MSEAESPARSARPEPPDGKAAAPVIDIELLAEKVYRLMRGDVRLERLCGAPFARRKEK